LVSQRYSGQLPKTEALILGNTYLNMTEDKRKELEGQAWKIEEYHRDLKQCCRAESFRLEGKKP
jgi:hypothetical protein